MRSSSDFTQRSMSALGSAFPWIAQRVTRGRLVHGGGVVALVAHAHQVIEHAERGDDLRRRRQERDDAHE